MTDERPVYRAGQRPLEALPLRSWLSGLRAAGRCAFLPYVTVGHPSVAAMPGILAMLRASGADGIELGVPFSDPIADGPVIQRSSFEALQGGATFRDALQCAERAAGLGLKVTVMSYLNPILQAGMRASLRRAAAAGVGGLIIPDLPVEEAGAWGEACERERIALALFAAPTTSVGRLRMIDREARGFIYYISVLGVTGERTVLPASLAGRLRLLRRQVQAPIVVGFGIGKPAQAAAVARLADGVIVGSAMVRRLAEWNAGPAKRREIARWTRSMAAAVHGKYNH